MARSSLSTHDTASLRKGNHLSHGQGAENGYAAAQDGGGAEFGNFRSVTPGGHTLDTSQPAFPVYHRRFANPAPLGLVAFALPSFVLSLINIGARGVTVPNVVVGPAIFYAGVGQTLASMWEFASGNTLAATSFATYGAFWFAYAFIVSPWSGIEAAYASPLEFANGVAFFLWGFFIVTFIFLIASLRSSITLACIFLSVDAVFLCLGIAELGTVGNPHNFQIAGGAFGLVASALAWYVALSNLLTPDTSFFTLPVGDLTKRD
ncbi:hypothetical protein BMF94_4218 [Rhodotorula taiwanensis]|uniref:Uncharacterized protein n=1 Tax=Rhodotorula taiwanensis TaxID=741276 RepID=A0A2S5B7R6_9BASI|nr:hypothetical protein BMF94_4218 [Rhodotorula taiwanensis]